MKKFVLGFITAILLTSSFLMVYAENIKEYICQKVDYEIVVDGEIYQDDELPALVYEGNTYLPVRKFCNLLGADIDWNGDLRRAEIKSPMMITKQISSTLDGDNTSVLSNEDIKPEIDNLTIYTYDGKQYIALIDIYRKYDSEGYAINYDPTTQTSTLVNKNTNVDLHQIDITDTTTVDGRSLIELTYYKKNLQPYLKLTD